MATSAPKPRYQHKPHYCIFCKLEFTRIYEHFLTKHKNEEKVQEVVSTKNKAERFWMWKRLTQEGDNYYNLKFSDSLGQKKIVKVPLSQSKKKKYYDCPTCLGRLRTNSKAQHMKMCAKIFRKNTEQGTEIENKKADMYDGVPEYYINKVRKSLYLNNFILHIFKAKENRKVVRTVIRDLISLESEIEQTYKGNKPLISFLKSKYVYRFIKCIQRLCEEDRAEKGKIFKYPFRAQRLCRLIGSLCRFLIDHYSEKNMNLNAAEVTNFHHTFEIESDSLIRKQAYKTIQNRRLKNPTPIPTTRDINVLVRKLRAKTPRLISALKEQKTNRAWRNLADNLLCRLTIFNRRRGGTIEKMKTSEYSASSEFRSKIIKGIKSLSNLEAEERNFLNNIRIIEIKHKRNNVLPIFVTLELQKAMDILFKLREYGQINKKNEHFFAAGRNSLNPISCVKVMGKIRQFLPDGVQRLITATNLRKHGATTTQDFTQQDSEEWMNHMGHSLQVPKDFYKQKELVSSILKTGKILKALDEGTLKYSKTKRAKVVPPKTLKDTQVNTVQLPLHETSSQTFLVNTNAPVVLLTSYGLNNQNSTSPAKIQNFTLPHNDIRPAKGQTVIVENRIWAVL